MPQKSFRVGLRKGLRYISQVFDGENEPEMQIGGPTDVKHVAHIGWEGPTSSNPSWMSDFHSAPLSTTFGEDPVPPKANSQEIPLGAVRGDSLSHDPTESPKKARRPRRPGSTDSVGTNSPARGTRHSRRNQSAGSTSGSEASDTPEPHRHRRHLKSNNNPAGPGAGCESPSGLPAIPKQRRRRSSKGLDSGSTRLGRKSKEAAAGSGDTPALPVVEEEEEIKV